MTKTYCITTYRNESRHSRSVFHQVTSARPREIIQVWAEVMAEDATRQEGVPLCNVIIHIDGQCVHTSTTGDVEAEPNKDAISIQYQYQDELNQILLAASDDCDLVLKQLKDQAWREENYHHKVPGPGHRG